MKRRSVLAAIAGVVSLAGNVAAQSLALYSGASLPGTAAVLNLTLNTPAGGTQPAAIQWTFSYSTALVTSFVVTPGPILTGANKFLTCNTDPQSFICVVAGYTTDLIPDGVVATVSVTLASQAPASIGVGNTVSASATAAALPLTAIGGTASVGVLGVAGLTCTTTILSTNLGAGCTVTLSQAAPGDTLVTLTTNASPLLAVPASVTVAAGATTATFNISAGSVLANQTATLTATLNGTAASVTIHLELLPTVSAFSCSVTTLSSNGSTTCTVTLSAAALLGSTVVTLSNNAAPGLSVPGSVPVLSGATTGTFTISTGTVSANQMATLTAALNGTTVPTTVLLEPPPTVSALSCTLASLASNGSTTCTVTLSEPALPGGTVVTLTNNASPVLMAPQTVTVSAGSMTATFNVSTGTISADQTSTLTATLNGTMTAATVSLIAPPGISSLGCTAGVLLALTSTTCTVNLTAPAPAGGALISVASNNPALTVSFALLEAAAGSTAVAFSVHAGTFNVASTAVLTATVNGSSKTASIALSLTSLLSSLTCMPSNVAPGNSGVCTATLTGASIGASIVTLASSSPLLAVPPSVTIGDGAVSTTFNFTTGRTVSEWVIITAALGTSSKTSVITITSGTNSSNTAVAGFSCDQPLLAGGRRMLCTIQLTAAGDSESTEVALTSNNGSLKTPATVGVRVGQSQLRFEIAADPVASFETAVLEARIGSATAQTAIALEQSDFPELWAPAEVSGKPGTPVRFTVSASNGNLRGAGLPRDAVFDAGGGTFEWTPTEQDRGVYKIEFTAANALGMVATKAVRLTVDSGLPVLMNLENGAGRSAPAGCSPGAVATVRGRWLFDGAIPAADRTGGSTELGGTRVVVNREYAAILRASADRVDLLCPASAAGAALAIAVETASGRSNSLDSLMQANAPGLYLAEDVRIDQAMAVRLGTSELVAIPNERFNARPAMPGDTLTFQATGIDCSSGTVGLSMKMGMDVVPVTSIKPLPGHAGVCTVQVVVPPSAAGDAVPVKLQVIGPDGVERTGNQGIISVAARSY